MEQESPELIAYIEKVTDDFEKNPPSYPGKFTTEQSKTVIKNIEGCGIVGAEDGCEVHLLTIKTMEKFIADLKEEGADTIYLKRDKDYQRGWTLEAYGVVGKQKSDAIYKYEIEEFKHRMIAREKERLEFKEREEWKRLNSKFGKLIRGTQI